MNWLLGKIVGNPAVLLAIVLAAFLQTRDGRIFGGSFKEGVRIQHPDGAIERLDQVGVRVGIPHAVASIVRARSAGDAIILGRIVLVQ